MRRMGDEGFTLIEVLIATFLMAMLSSMGLMLLNTSINAKRQLDRTVDAVQSLELARAMIRSDLIQAVNRTTRDEYGALSPDVFAGDASGRHDPLMTFVTNGKEHPDPDTNYSTLQKVSYRLEEQGLVRESRDRIDASPESLVTERVLVAGVKAIKIEFYDGQSWTDSWGDASGRTGSGSAPPLAVSIELDTADYGVIPLMFATAQAYR